MLVLASSSPRRRQLIRILGVEHIVDPVSVDETPRDHETPTACAQRLARAKARAGARRHPGQWVLGADTVVVLDGQPLGKPESAADAEAMLRRMAGRRHSVITAVALARDEELHDRCDVTSVWLRPMDRTQVAHYVATGEPLDKAGSYGAQGVGALLVERIEGDYFGVIGLPVRLVADLLTEVGIPHVMTR